MKYIYKCTELISDVANELTDNKSEGSFFFGIINAVLSVPTAAANALVIVAILTSSLRTPSYLLLTSLAFSDVVAGLSQAIYSSLVFLVFERKNVAFCFSLPFYYITTSWASWTSILTVSAISVDRYLAIRLKMRYTTIVKQKRVKLLVGATWIFSFGAMASPVVFEAAIPTFGAFNFCFQATCLSVIIFCYAMSFRALKIHCAQTHPQGNQQQPNSTTQSNVIDVLKYRKLLKTMILIVVVILVCHVPLVAVFIVISAAPGSYRSQEFTSYMETFDLPVISGLVCVMYLNSLLNPFIYLTRMTDIRRACLRLLERLITFISSHF